jgi:dTMP kinase
MIIAFSGIDGSGKTTYSKVLAACLGKMGIRASYSRPAYHANEIVKAHCERHLGDAHAYYPGLDPDFYLSTLAIDWMQWELERVSKGETNDVHCCDRHILDVFAQAHQYGARFSFLETIFAVFGAPDLNFWLDISPENAHRRIVVRGEPKPHRLESLPELKRLKTAYEKVMPYAKRRPIRLDAMADLQENIGTIIEILRLSHPELGLERFSVPAAKGIVEAAYKPAYESPSKG